MDLDWKYLGGNDVDLSPWSDDYQNVVPSPIYLILPGPRRVKLDLKSHFNWGLDSSLELAPADSSNSRLASATSSSGTATKESVEGDDQWKVDLHQGNEFRQRRTAYSARSYFVLIFADSGVAYDREKLGELLLPDTDEWGCIDPPGPIGGFGKIFSQARLEKNNGVLTVGQLKKLAAPGKIVKEITPFIDGWFTVSPEKKTFVEGPTGDFAQLVDFLSLGQIPAIPPLLPYRNHSPKLREKGQTSDKPARSSKSSHLYVYTRPSLSLSNGFK